MPMKTIVPTTLQSRLTVYCKEKILIQTTEDEWEGLGGGWCSNTEQIEKLTYVNWEEFV